MGDEEEKMDAGPGWESIDHLEAEQFFSEQSEIQNEVINDE